MSSWLCQDEMDRERLLDMEERIKPVRAIAMCILGIALIAAGPWIGWWTLIPLVVAGALFGIADATLDRWERPELVVFAAWAGSEVTIAIAVALSGGPSVATLSWLATPVVTLSARLPLRGVIAGIAITIGCLLGVAFGVHSGAVLHE